MKENAKLWVLVPSTGITEERRPNWSGVTVESLLLVPTHKVPCSTEIEVVVPPAGFRNLAPVFGEGANN